MTKPTFWALTPLYIFFLLFIVTFLITGDIANMPIVVAFFITSVASIILCRGKSLIQKVATYCKGFANETLTLMILIFILAGAFSATARSMGAVDASVNIILSILPTQYIYFTLFITACFISISMGTSVGTIAALTPIAIGISSQLHLSAPFILAVIIGGAMFGDNLSFISDTTIAATESQGCKMKDKFYNNIKIVFPVLIVMLCIYFYLGQNIDLVNNLEIEDHNWIKIIPYLIVLILAICGVNVILVLTLGILSSGIIGITSSSMTMIAWFQAIEMGIVKDMGELIIVTLMAGGVFSVIGHNGGITWLLQKISSRIRTSRGAELSISGLLVITNMATANNTIAILIIGPVAKNISDKFSLNKKRVASILDTMSCFTQGLLPYGAQVLIATQISQIVTPTEIIPYLYYPMLLGVATLISIFVRYPK